MDDVSTIRRYLGGRSTLGATPQTELDFVSLLRAGFPFESFTRMRDLVELSDDAFCRSLGIPKRTAARRKKSAERLKPNESELLLRLARVMASARGIFGSDAKARSWLLRENRALGGVSPMSLLDTDIGSQQVLNVLLRIDAGVYS